ncbi:MAG: 3-oxoacyl-ACP reductase FabG [Oscillospiraceae bacterium]|nr:3-oxoacyl-ACP reductase FabG [Oscillospiraceae bacterium]
MLKNKFAVITGSGSGIGAATAKIFVRENVSGIAIVDYNFEAACKTAEELGPTAFPVRCDVSDPEQVDAAIAQIMEKFGRIDILVNNAAITRDAIFHKMTREQWLQVINTNLNSVFYWTHGVYPQMRECGYGRIINMSSNASNGNPGQCNYSATKAAVIGFAKTLAKEAGRKGITVNCVAPSATETEMFNAVPDHVKEAMCKANPMNRLAKPCEMGEVIAFLASERASYVNGQCVFVNGGK